MGSRFLGFRHVMATRVSDEFREGVELGFD